jgi:DNA-binding NarL/FixJ family response regulator
MKDAEKRFTVLLVDKDRVFLKVVRQCLILQGGLDVETAISSQEAFKKMEKINPDVIVCSFQTRGENPLVFLKELRDKGDVTPFIGLISDEEHEVALKALDLGAAGFVNTLGKPEVVYPAIKDFIVSVVKTG